MLQMVAAILPALVINATGVFFFLVVTVVAAFIAVSAAIFIVNFFELENVLVELGEVFIGFVDAALHYSWL